MLSILLVSKITIKVFPFKEDLIIMDEGVTTLISKRAISINLAYLLSMHYMYILRNLFALVNDPSFTQSNI